MRVSCAYHVNNDTLKVDSFSHECYQALSSLPAFMKREPGNEAKCTHPVSNHTSKHAPYMDFDLRCPAFHCSTRNHSHFSVLYTSDRKLGRPQNKCTFWLSPNSNIFTCSLWHSECNSPGVAVSLLAGHTNVPTIPPAKGGYNCYIRKMLHHPGKRPEQVANKASLVAKRPAVAKVHTQTVS